MGKRKKKEGEVSLSEPQPKHNERPNGGVTQAQPQEQAPQTAPSPGANLQALLEKIPTPFRGVVENLLPQIVSFIDARIEAKLQEYIPRFGEATKQAIQDVIKQYLGQAPNPNPNPVQAPIQAQDVQVSQRDLLVAQLLQSILGRRGGLEEELKRFAEIKQLAESISGGGLSPTEVFKIYRYGMLDTMRMLYLMTRKKFPLEKLLMEEEEEEKEGESK